MQNGLIREPELWHETSYPIKTSFSLLPSCFISNTDGNGVIKTAAQEIEVAVRICVLNLVVDTGSKSDYSLKGPKSL